MAIEKMVNILIEKKENCGHKVLSEVITGLKIEETVVFSNMVKTADLYLYNEKFKKFFDAVLTVAIAFRDNNDIKSEKKDLETIKKDIKSNSEIAIKIARDYDKKYRECLTSEDALELVIINDTLKVIKEAKTISYNNLETVRREYRNMLRKEYGLI